MTRILLSNGDLSVGLDGVGQVKEIYYPDYASGNHVGGGAMRHKIGVFVDGAVHWLDDGAWRVTERYYPGSLVGQTIADNRWLGIRLEIQDSIDSELNVLARSINVVNLTGRHRQLRLYFHQAFLISGNPYALSGAQYIPSKSDPNYASSALVHHGCSKAFAVSLIDEAGNDFDDYSVGRFGDYAGTTYSGVWCDAADGRLAQNKAETGKVDSIFSVNVDLAAHDSSHAQYLLAASESAPAALKALGKFTHEGTAERLNKTSEHYKSWLGSSLSRVRDRAPRAWRLPVVESLSILRANMNTSGAIVTGTASDRLTPLTQTGKAALIADTFSRASLEIDSIRIFNFLLRSSGGELLQPSYFCDGSAGENRYHYSDSTDVIKQPINLSDSALTLLSLARSTQRGLASGEIAPEWKKCWEHFGLNLANSLADSIDVVTKLPKASCHPGDEVRLTTAFDVTTTYGSMLEAAHVCDAFGDVDGVIKYSSIADDIAENVNILWNETRHYFYHGILRQGNNYTYSGKLDTYAYLGCLATELLGRYLDEAEDTLKRAHLCTNGTFLGGEDVSATDDAALREAAVLSITLARLKGDNVGALLKAGQKLLDETKSPVAQPNAAANLPVLRAAIISTLLAD